MISTGQLFAGWLTIIKNAQVFTGLGVFLRLKLRAYNPLLCVVILVSNALIHYHCPPFLESPNIPYFARL